MPNQRLACAYKLISLCYQGLDLLLLPKVNKDPAPFYLICFVVLTTYTARHLVLWGTIDIVGHGPAKEGGLLGNAPQELLPSSSTV